MQNRIFSTTISSFCNLKCKNCYWHEQKDPIPLNEFINIVKTFRRVCGYLILNYNPGDYETSVLDTVELYKGWSTIQVTSTTEWFVQNWRNCRTGREILDKNVTHFDISLDKPKIRQGDCDTTIIEELPKSRRTISLLVHPGSAHYLYTFLKVYDLCDEKIHITFPKGDLNPKSVEDDYKFLKDLITTGRLPHASFKHNHICTTKAGGQICSMTHLPFIDINRCGEFRTCPYSTEVPIVVKNPNDALDKFFDLYHHPEKYSIGKDCVARNYV